MDRVIFWGCFLLLATGILIGIGMGAPSNLLNSVRDAFELLSFLGTAVTAVVALIALTSWQIQFRHSEKWKALKCLQEALDGGLSAHSYIMYLFTLVAQNQAASWMDKQSGLTDEFIRKQKDWFEYCSKIDKAWSQIELLYGEGELKGIESHRSIEESVRQGTSMLLETYLKMEPTDLLQLHKAAEECAANASERSRQLFLHAGRMLKSLVR